MPKRRGKGTKASTAVVTELRREQREMKEQFPRPLAGNQVFPVVIRQIVNNTVGAAVIVTGSGLLNSIVSANSAVLASRIFGAIKVTRIRLWAAQLITGGAAVTTSSAFTGVGLFWLSRYGQVKSEFDYGTFDRPAHLDSRPPQKSVVSDYINTGSPNEGDSLFTVFGSTLGAAGGASTSPPAPGTVIDVHMTCVLLDSNTVPVNVAGVGLTIGRVYYRGFDNIAVGASVFSTTGLTQA